MSHVVMDSCNVAHLQLQAVAEGTVVLGGFVVQGQASKSGP
jgi:hypothetical protein